MLLKDKVVFITASTRGIGRSCALECAKEGANVVINYHRNDAAAKELEDYMTEIFDTKIQRIKADITKEEDIQRALNEVLEKMGRIDVLVNNAAVVFDKKTLEKVNIPDLTCNLVGTFYSNKYIGKYMFEQKKGKIINISSIGGIQDYDEEHAKKDTSIAGLLTMTRSLAHKFGPYITVNTVIPKWVNTPVIYNLEPDFIADEIEKIPLKRFAEPKEIAKLVVFLASENANYINGTAIRIDGGY